MQTELAIMQQKALTCFEQEDYQQALDLFQACLELDPITPTHAWYLGLTALFLGYSDQAQQIWERTLKMDPTSLLKDLVQILQKEGMRFVRSHKLLEAEACCRQILQLDPGHLSSYLNLGQILGLLSRFEEAIQVLEVALVGVPDSSAVLHELGMIYKQMGYALKATRYFQQAICVQPDHIPSHLELNTLLASDAFSWHFPMMNDRGRNLAFQEALRATITPTDHVLDIGSGSGLLAMMALQAGAKQVTTCEAVDLVAAKAKEIIAANGYDDRIQVIPKKSTDIRIPEDLNSRANVIVTETFSAGLLGEGAIATIEHAVTHLAHSQVKVIPDRAVIYAAAFESRAIWEQLLVDQTEGFNLNPFNEFSWPFRILLNMNLYPHHWLSDPCELTTLTLTKPPKWPITSSIRIPINQEGVIHGVCCWFDLGLTEHVWLSSGCHPQSQASHRASHWGQVIYLCDPAQPVPVGGAIRVDFFCHEKLFFITV
jgi:tetratricopeptide (TPR) repeat protein